MEQLKVDSFLTVKKADLIIKPFVIVIGSQASGKSVLAKLVYFMKDTFSTDMIESIRSNEPLSKFEKSIKQNFKKIFPEYTWQKSNFSIEYMCGLKSVKISNTKRRRYKFDISYSNNIKDFYRELRSSYNQALAKAQKKEKDSFREVYRRREVFDETLAKVSAKYSDQDPFLEDALFIPAGRSFFSTLKQNIFRLLSESVVIDPFLKEFGAAFESVKNIYGEFLPRLLKKEFRQYEILLSEILCGKFEHTKDEDWITKGLNKVKLSNASSGQQEALPMLLVLSFYPFIRGQATKGTFFIEEPEAHLFPSSQKRVIELIGYIYNLTKQTKCFFITTHSPYVISAINNLLVANRAIKLSANSELIDKLKDKTISPDSITAYAVDDGIFRPILQEDAKMIDAAYIDSVSSEFEKELDELLGYTYGK